MKNRALKLLTIMGLLISLTFSCTNKNQQAQHASQALPFPVIKVEQRTVTKYQKFPTNIEGKINSDIRPKVGGYISEVLTKEGQEVKQGQLLFRLETYSLNQQAKAAKAGVNVAKVEVDKLKPLVDKNIISQVQLETAKANLAQAKSNYNSILANISYANVKSPVNGVVGSINYRKGDLVSAQDPLPLTNVSSIKNVYAYFSMNERDFLNFIENSKGATMKEKIAKLPKIKLQMANGSIYKLEGTIETIAGDINSQTGTISFRAKFNNTEGLLRNGSSGVVMVPKTYNNKMVIPSESTFERQGNTFVYKVVNDSLVTTPITIEADAGKLFVLKDGLKPGETILAKGLNKVRSGAKIRSIPTPLDSILNSFQLVFKK